MKKALLLSLAVAGAASMAQATDYVGGGCEIKTSEEGYALKLEWGLSSQEATGDAIRAGVGSNDLFFLANKSTNKVEVWGPKGLEQEIPVPAGNVWVSATADDAQHVLIRVSDYTWPSGSGQYAGCYYPGDGHSFYAIDAKTQKIIGNRLYFEGGNQGRFDALGHVSGDILDPDDFWRLYAVGDGTAGLQAFTFDGIEEGRGAKSYDIVINEAFKGTGADKVVTMGIAQAYGERNENYAYTKMAVYPNNLLEVTSSEKGLGNGIMEYALVEDVDEDENPVEIWRATGRFFVTPQHGSNQGFQVFTLAGKDYIVYTSGAGGGTNAPDAFAIAEVRFTDTPETDNDVDMPALIARFYPQASESGANAYKTGSNFTSYNVEPVPGDDHSVYI
ncbi:MAG: hypothetical protein K2L28_04090, partial [Muribaculaceae bacterium]|nr:hypothetical protein [Muribaculaceae bacterium]